jgi:hypothetical protein
MPKQQANRFVECSGCIKCIRKIQTGGACPPLLPISNRTRTLINSLNDLEQASCYRLFDYIKRYGPITLSAQDFPECDVVVIYENGVPIAASSYLQ